MRQHFRAVARFLFDRRLHPAKGADVLLRNQRKDVHAAVHSTRAARRKPQGGTGLVGLVNHYQKDAHELWLPLPQGIC